MCSQLRIFEIVIALKSLLRVYQVIESGLFQHWTSLIFDMEIQKSSSQKLYTTDESVEEMRGALTQLHMDDVQGALWILLAGLGVSTAFFVVELIWDRIKRRRPKNHLHVYWKL